MFYVVKMLSYQTFIIFNMSQILKHLFYLIIKEFYEMAPACTEVNSEKLSSSLEVAQLTVAPSKPS